VTQTSVVTFFHNLRLQYSLLYSIQGDSDIILSTIVNVVNLEVYYFPAL